MAVIENVAFIMSQAEFYYLTDCFDASTPVELAIHLDYSENELAAARADLEAKAFMSQTGDIDPAIGLIIRAILSSEQIIKRDEYTVVADSAVMAVLIENYPHLADGLKITPFKTLSDLDKYWQTRAQA